jgi:hypothetical protein
MNLVTVAATLAIFAGRAGASAVTPQLPRVRASSMVEGSTSTTVINFTASGTWVVPTGATTVAVSLWGGGGGGAAPVGGGGGAYGLVGLLYVAPGTRCRIVVGRGGKEVAGNATPGGGSSINCGYPNTTFGVAGGSGGYPAAGHGAGRPGGRPAENDWDWSTAGHDGSTAPRAPPAQAGKPYGEFGSGGIWDGHDHHGGPGLVQLWTQYW